MQSFTIFLIDLSIYIELTKMRPAVKVKVFLASVLLERPSYTKFSERERDKVLNKLCFELIRAKEIKCNSWNIFDSSST